MSFLKIYLDKIGFESELKVNIETINRLQLKHLSRFPFENLNPLFGKEVLLDDESLTKKFLQNNRGGYCFEQNLIFQNILTQVGFKVRGLMARVHTDGKILGRTHLCQLIELGQKRYISDVGFGGLVSPQILWLDTEQVQMTAYGKYRIVKKNEDYAVQLLMKDGWRELYNFNLNTYYFADYLVSNHYTSTSFRSHFTHELTVSMVTHNGKKSLRNFDFSVYEGVEIVEKRKLKSVSEIKQILNTDFGISVNEFPEFEKQLADKMAKLKNEQ